MGGSLLTRVHLEVAQVVKSTILPMIMDARTSLFLIGADQADRTSLRSKLKAYFESPPLSRSYNVLYPEVLFAELTHEHKFNLLKLENLLASSVHAVVICAESPGSYTELGAFCNHTALSERIVVVSDVKYRKSNSFITLGPIKHIQSLTGSVVWFDPNEPIDKLVEAVIKKVKTKPAPPVNIQNPVIAENFVLPYLMLAGPLTRSELTHVVSQLEPGDAEQAQVACSAALAVLFKQRAVMVQGGQYSVTHRGNKRIWDAASKHQFAVRQQFDKLRVMLLNARLNRSALSLGGKASRS